MMTHMEIGSDGRTATCACGLRATREDMILHIETAT